MALRFVALAAEGVPLEKREPETALYNWYSRRNGVGPQPAYGAL